MEKYIKKYLVSEMSKNNKDRVKLKALKYSLTIDELVLKAIDSYNPTVRCSKEGCFNDSQVTIINHNFIVGADKLETIVYKVPTLYCEKCSPDKLAHLDVELIANLNKLVEAEAIKRFIDTKDKTYEFVFEEFEFLLL